MDSFIFSDEDFTLNVVKIEEIEAFYIQYIDMLCFGLCIQWRFLFHEQETVTVEKA